MRRKLFISAAAFLLAVLPSGAQWTDYTFTDNWFGGVSVGANTTLGSLHQPLQGPGTALGFSLGKWTSPSFGVRAGLHGVRNKFETGGQNAVDFFAFAHADALWNLQNEFFGYNPNRPFEAIPFMGFGVLATRTGSSGAYALELAGVAGALGNYRINDKFGVNLELGGILSRTSAWTYTGSRVIAFPYATLGMEFNLSEISFPYNRPVRGGRATEAERKSYEEMYLSDEFKGNWFFTAAGGVNTVWRGGSAFSTGTSPAVSLSFGKWFTPVFGARAALNGISNKLYQGEVNLFNTFLFAHADVLMNVHNIFSPYRSDRIWNAVPAAGFGVVATVQQGSRGRELEFGALGGLLNTIRLSPQMDLIVEPGLILSRASAWRLGGRPVLTLPYGTLGLNYNFGRQGFRDEVQEENRNRELQMFSIGTNLVDYADLVTINADFGMALSRHFSLELQYRVNPGIADKNISTYSAGFRFWPWVTFSGWWINALGQYQDYSMQESGSNGSRVGGVLGFGYCIMLARHLNLDLGVSGWAGYRMSVTDGDGGFVRADNIYCTLSYVFGRKQSGK